MRHTRVGVRGPRLPRVIGQVGRPDHPPVAGLDFRSSYTPGYNPAVGIPVLIRYLITEEDEFFLTEDEFLMMLE